MPDKLPPRDTVRSGLRGSNLDQVRRSNLSNLLSRVHQTGGTSRAQLTRDTGLNRSTIADLVGELVELGLVIEASPDPTNQVGRPSPIVVPSDRVVALAVNPELDAVSVAAVALGGRVLVQTRHLTKSAPSVDEVVSISTRAIDEVMKDLGTEYRIVGVGLAIPGLVRARDGLVTLAPHLDWHDEPISERLRAATGLEVFAGNDARLGATAEHVRGAGRGFEDLVYLNGGASGIGGCLIMAGTLLGGASGYAGEIGHTLVNSSGARCYCGSSGCLETEVARAPLLAALGISDPTELDEALRTRSDEPAVAAVVDRQLGFLAVALANTVNVFNPQLIVLGGFLASLHAVAGDRLLQLVGSIALAGSHEDVQIRTAQLGDDLLAIGAAELAFESLIADP
ncbi:MAG: ROK family protein, partial [Rhodoglobus sp.]|nr:ROK family protein [Rhodoglobus sp.]